MVLLEYDMTEEYKKVKIEVEVLYIMNMIEDTELRIASGKMFGKNQRVQLHLYDIPPMIEKVKGVACEIYDCAFPTENDILTTDNLDRAFDDIDVALLVGSKPRGPGEERADLLNNNGIIFKQQADALNKFARKSVKVTVVGNPANTNCMILANNCSDIPLENFTAITRLDHDSWLCSRRYN